MLNRRRPQLTFLFICLGAFALSLFTVTVQVRELGFERLGERYFGKIEIMSFGFMGSMDYSFQLNNHRQVIEGRRGNPFQYRILTEWIVAGALNLTREARLPYEAALAFLTVRVLQNLFIFVFAVYYYQRVGVNVIGAVLGAVMLAWSFTHALFGADLQFNTYSDVLFYLAAGLAISYRRYGWIVPITVLAAFNRETSGLIPILLVAAGAQWQPRLNVPRRILGIAGVSLVLYAAIFVGLRFAFGPQPLIVPYGYEIGAELFVYNLTLPATYLEVFGVLSLLPILAWIGRSNWTPIIRRFFWTLVPIWGVIHLFAAVLAESRLVLVPTALVFIPAVLLSVSRFGGDLTTRRS